MKLVASVKGALFGRTTAKILRRPTAVANVKRALVQPESLNITVTMVQQVCRTTQFQIKSFIIPAVLRRSSQQV